MTLRGIFLIGGLIAAFVVSVLLMNEQITTAAYVYLVVVGAAFIEFVFGDMLSQRSFPFDTERKRSLMEERLGKDTIKKITERLQEVMSGFSACDTSMISATVHVFVELSPTADQPVRKGLLQLTDYVGPYGGTRGRITTINQGIIGRCARTGKLETVDFADEDEYSELMVRDFGFTKEQTEGHTKTGRSYLAAPLLNQNNVVGVLYFFSTEPQVFPRSVDWTKLEDVAREFVNYMVIVRLV